MPFWSWQSHHPVEQLARGNYPTESDWGKLHTKQFSLDSFLIHLTLFWSQNPPAVSNESKRRFGYPPMTKSLGDFKLNVASGSVTNPEIAVIVGKKGVGKTTFIRLLAGLAKKDEDLAIQLVESSLTNMPIKISYKPQLIDDIRKGIVGAIFLEEIPDSFTNPQVMIFPFP